MMSTILAVFKYMFAFIALMTLVIIMLMIITDYRLKKKKISEKNIKLYGVFLELTNKQLFSISISVVKIIFLLFSIFMFNVNIFVLIALLSLVIIFNVINYRLINFFIDFILHVILYYMMLSKDIFFNYLMEVGNEWYVNILLLVVLIFTTLLSLIIFFKEIDYIIRKNKFVKKKLDKDTLQFGIFRKKQLKHVLKKVADKETHYEG